MLKAEVLYSNLIIKTSADDNKFNILSDIDNIDKALFKYYNYIKRIKRFEKYNKNNIISDLIALILDLPTNVIIKKMFINMIKSSDTDIARKTYNIILNKYNYVKINIITADVVDSKIDANELPLTAQINYITNPAIIGGNIIILNSLKIDSSFAGRLNAIEDQLISFVG